MHEKFSVRSYLHAARDFGVTGASAAVLLAIELATVLFEFGGVAMLIPAFQFMQNNGDIGVLVQKGGYWLVLVRAFEFSGLALNLATLLLVTFSLFLLRQTLVYTRLLYSVWVRQNLAHTLRDNMFAGYLRARNSYHQQVSQGAFINELTIELPKAVNTVFMTIVVVGQAFLIFVYFLGLVYLSPEMTAVCVGVLALSMLTLRRFLRLSQQMSSQITEAHQKFSSFLVERIRATRFIRLSGTQRSEIGRLAQLSDACRRRIIRLSRIQATSQVVIEPVTIALAFGVIYVGYRMLGMSAETIGVFVIVLARLLPVFRSALMDYQKVLGQWASLRAIADRLSDARRLSEADGGGATFERMETGIRFERVSFGYPDRSEKALDNVSLSIRAGGITGIVGPSGAGKSTLIDLLPRLIEPTAGEISIDGRPLHEFSLKSLRSGISYVSQQVEIFDSTPAEHIGYGAGEADIQRIRHAARLAGAESFIMKLPQGYATVLGENGVFLSGGQRQRLDLARAILRRAPILILDEPASHLDHQTETALKQALHDICREFGTTIILVAHGMKLVQEADHIAVLERGRIREQGTPRELLADAGGWFARAVRGRDEMPVYSDEVL